MSVITESLETILNEVATAGSLRKGQIIVIGTSTSEVLGKRIGTSGTEEAAKEIYAAVEKVSSELELFAAFQCCEHLNRALVVERALLERYPSLEPVSVIPVPKAGGSMAAYAYKNMQDPVVIESIRAHAGVDIGETLIGMHLKSVAVPFRPSIRFLGEARVTAAYTRPKLIGGARAVYEVVPETTGNSNHCE